MRAIPCCAFACLLVSAQTPAARAQSYPYEIARSNSLAFAAWRWIVPPEFHRQAWIASLAGTASPLNRLTVDQKTFYYGKVCIPHDCGGNFTAFLIATDGSQASGLLVSRTLGVGRRYFGAPNREARALLERKIQQE
jgi:hypothetical protein